MHESFCSWGVTLLENKDRWQPSHKHNRLQQKQQSLFCEGLLQAEHGIDTAVQIGKQESYLHSHWKNKKTGEPTTNFAERRSDKS